VTKASFGKFRIVGQIARGGMAEVFLCRLQGIGGFEKDVVVKCIIPERADDPNFVTMFLDEARTVAHLSHPGIVQVFEIGDDDGIPYIAMEYVKGVTLATVMRELHRQKKMHYGHCAKVIAGICEALDYAHNAVGGDGEPLGLVHRDVTPGNIVISREGVPKLLDFGVAKTNRRLSETQAGTLKGKLRYMAPEQLSMEPLDSRADIFSLGVCLYELTTGRHPFGPIGDSDVALLKSIVDGPTIKPTDFLPDYPPVLEEIVLSAIERSADRRCPSARVLHDRLEAFTGAGPHASSTREVVAWLRELIPDYGSLTKTGTFPAIGNYPMRPMRPGTGGGPTTSASTRAGSFPGRGGSSIMPANDLTAGGGSRRSRRLRRGWATWVRWGAGALLAVGVVALVLSRFTGSTPPAALGPPGRIAPPALSDDETAGRFMDAAERLASQERFDPALHMLTKAGELRIKNVELNIRLAQLRDQFATAALVNQASHHLKQHEWNLAIDTAKNALDRNPDNVEARRIIDAARAGEVLRPSARREVRRAGTLSISTTPPGMVYVDDEPVGRSPLSRQLSVGSHKVQVRSHGYRPGEAAVHVSPGQTVTLVLPLVADAALQGGEGAGGGQVKKASLITDPSLPAGAGAGPGEHAAPGTPVVSAMPHTPTPKPTLPRLVRASDAERLWQVCQLVELLVVSRAGVTRQFARGITAGLRREVSPNGLVYPVAMYYFIVHEAAAQHDNTTAAANLAAAHRDGSIVKLNDLPAVERDL
jgi:serine/threonine protein kinase